ncbi:MAG: GspE/PulE family protein [Rhodothermaceae bacterium]
MNNEIKKILSAEFSFENNVIVLEKTNLTLTVGISDKNNHKIINDISFNTGYQVVPKELQADLIFSKLSEMFPEYAKKTVVKNPGKEINHNENSNIEYVNQIINSAISSKASDIHFEVSEKSFRIRFRIDGHLRDISTMPKEKFPALVSRLKIMANLDIAEKRRPQDGKIRHIYNGRNIDIRMSSLPSSFGEKIVLRILDKSNQVLNLKNIGLNEVQYKKFTDRITLPFGMILITGPTGSGKTTSLYAALNEIHSEDKNILTIEDPIEYNLTGINQCQVNPDIGFTFANALKTFLRQDPDVIMVGEIRDKETAEIAIRSALTGHLVFSTIHTNDSVSAVTRLTDMGVEPFLVASAVKLIIAQRLVRNLCSCKKETGDSDPLKKYTAEGCVNCNFTGYSGRTALFELFSINEKISSMITSEAGSLEIKKELKNNGFITLREAGVEKVNHGITTYEEVLRETMV